MAKERYLFGPVPSRRLGLSLGVDVVPLKTCTQNCVYCQLGRNQPTCTERARYVPSDAVLGELENRICGGLEAEHITFSGSGEPTLHSELGCMIDAVHAMTSIPVAVITNGTLLSRPDVRSECARADVVLPSLDAGDAETFQRINRPDPTLRFEAFVDGLCRFRDEYDGRLWLEVFLVEPVNTTDEQVDKIARLIERIGPDRVDLNTAVRPTTEPGIGPVDSQRMAQIAARLGPRACIVVDFDRPASPQDSDHAADRILDMLQRRPCTVDDLAAALGLHHTVVLKALGRLESAARVQRRMRDGAIFFVAC